MYKELRKGLPKPGRKIKTKAGKAHRDISVNPLTRSGMREEEE